MENSKQSKTIYKGDSPRWAATKEFFITTFGVGILIDFGCDAAGALIDRRKGESFWQTIKREKLFGGLFLLEAVVAIGAGISQAGKAYRNAEQMQKDHHALVVDNVGMRSQLNHTGQILPHVATEVEKGNLADSELHMKCDTPSTYAARTEAKRVEHALREAKHAHHASHVEQVLNEPEASRAIH